MRRSVAITLFACCMAGAQAQSGDGLFEADSKANGQSKMDIVVKEVERRPRASVIDIRISNIGSSVGSSFFLVCSIRSLAQERGGYRHVVKLEQTPKPGQMLIGFLKDAKEDPTNLGPEFKAAGATVIDMEQFAPIGDASVCSANWLV